MCRQFADQLTTERVAVVLRIERDRRNAVSNSQVHQFSHRHYPSVTFRKAERELRHKVERHLLADRRDVRES